MIGTGSTTRPGRRLAVLPLVIAIGSAGAMLLGAPAKGDVSAPADAALAGGPPETMGRPADPWARFNRGSYRFNAALDRVLIGPVARTYKRLLPSPVRRAVRNVVGNLREPSTAINALVQARPKASARAVARFVANSTVGVLGVFDVASRVGLDRSPADFGQTLGRYGMPEGPYLYLPVIGPTGLRDGLGSLINAAIDPVSIATGGAQTDLAVGRLVARGVDARAEADEPLRTIAADATDPYATTRSAYLQYRSAIVREATGTPEALPDFGEPVLDVPPSEAEAPAPAIETPLPSAEPK